MPENIEREVFQTHSAMSDQNRIDEVENYLQGKMTLEQRASFESRMETEAELQEEVELYRNVFAGIRKGGRDLLKDELKVIESSVRGREDTTTINRGKSRTITPWILGIAASLVILISALVFVITRNDGGYTALYESYYKTYPNVITSIERGGSESVDQLAAFEAYEQGNYQQAYKELQVLSAKEPNNLSLKFYSAISLMEQEEFAQALVLLEPVAQARTDFSSQAKWYAALCLIRLNKIKEARDYLQSLSQNDGPYKKRATQLLSELSR
jgi:anti-sigma-K factor RskA